MITVTVDGQDFDLKDNAGIMLALRKKVDSEVAAVVDTEQLRHEFTELLIATTFYLLKTNGIVARYEAVNVLAMPTGIIKSGLDSLAQLGVQTTPELIVPADNAQVEGDEL